MYDPAGLQRAPAPPERVLADRVEDDVVRLAVLREVLLQVVDDLVGSERAHELDVLRVADRRDVARRSAWRAARPRFRWIRRRRRRGCSAPLGESALRRHASAMHRSVADRRGLLEAHASRLVRKRAAARGRRRTPRVAPERTPKTSSPTSNSVTAAPTASTSPASSMPRILRFGRRRPVKKRAKNGWAPRRRSRVRVTVVACTLTRTSSSFGTGRSTSSSSQDLRWSVPVVDDRFHALHFLSSR